MLRSCALAAVAALALGSTAKADLYFFAGGDAPGGTGINIVGLDPDAGNILNVGVTTAANNFVLNAQDNGNRDTTFTAYGQATIGRYSPPGGGAAQNLPSNLTVVFGVTEQVTGVSGPGLGQVGSTVQSDIVAGGVNFFEIYANNSGTNNLTGQGFANGDLILSGTLDSLTNPLAVTNNNANAGDLDQFNGDSYSGFDTVGTSGNTGILVNNLWLNPDYFRLVNGETLTSLLLSTQFQAPFNGVDPSARFLIGGVETLAGAGLGAGNFSNLGLGNINGGQPGQGGPSVQVQGDANIGFQLEEAPPPPGVPEPATIAVFGLMAGMGGLVHRRRNAKVVA